MYIEYIQERELRPEFKKKFISLFNGWLGKDNLHKLDEVTENGWQCFNTLLELISKNYSVAIADISVAVPVYANANYLPLSTGTATLEFEGQRIWVVKDIEVLSSISKSSDQRFTDHFSRPAIRASHYFMQLIHPAQVVTNTNLSLTINKLIANIAWLFFLSLRCIIKVIN